MANFIGESNIIPGIMLEDYLVRFNGHTYKCVDAGFGRNKEVDVVVRPEDVDIVPADQSQVTGKVVSVVFMGVHYEVDVDCGGYEWVIQTTDFVRVGETVGISIQPDAIHIMKKTRQTNIFDGTVSSDGAAVEIGDWTLPCAVPDGIGPGDAVLVEIAPADVAVVPPEGTPVTGTVKGCMFMGTHYDVTVLSDDEEWIGTANDFMEEGEEVGLSVPEDRVRISKR